MGGLYRGARGKAPMSPGESKMFSENKKALPRPSEKGEGKGMGKGGSGEGLRKGIEEGKGGKGKGVWKGYKRCKS